MQIYTLGVRNPTKRKIFWILVGIWRYNREKGRVETLNLSGGPSLVA